MSVLFGIPNLACKYFTFNAVIMYMDFSNLIIGILIPALMSRKPQIFHENFALFGDSCRMA